MFSTIIIGIAAVIAALSAAIGIALKKSDDRELRDAAPKFKTGAVLTIIIALIVTLFASTTIVPPRTVGVKVALGKPVGSVGNGFHFKAPWTSVEKMDASIQTTSTTGTRPSPSASATTPRQRQTPPSAGSSSRTTSNSCSSTTRPSTTSATTLSPATSAQP